MKKRLATILAIALCATSCLNDYLDRAPDAGLDEEEVFTKLENFKQYFYSVYYGANFNIRPHFGLSFDGNNQKFNFESLTDMCDQSRYQWCQPVKQGDGASAIWVVGYNTYMDAAAKAKYTWQCIRVCNMTIEKIDMLQDAGEKDRNDLLGQAYFVRAFCHFEIFRFYGAVPYINKVLGADDEWDLPAEDDQTYLRKVMDDFQTAADYFMAAGLMRRDPVEGAGHLADVDQDKPNGVTALALKGRAALYAASPLSNPVQEKKLWEQAAEMNYEALKTALTLGYRLLDKADYSKLFYGVYYNDEHLWTYSRGQATSYNNERMNGLLPFFFFQEGTSCRCPTQNFVDKFETAGGYPLNTPEERNTATAAGEYNEQNPFINRDFRFEFSIIYNQKPITGIGDASIYVNEDGSLPPGSLLQKAAGRSDCVSETFYYENKRTGPMSIKNQKNVILIDPVIRLAELYLNYAEAANEAYGPNGAAPGADLSSLQALQAVRDRVGLPAVREDYIKTTETLRPRIKNERTVELFEECAHYYCDIRRWKDAPAIGRSTLIGLRAVKLSAGPSAEYPTGFRYERFNLPANRQIAWKNDGMYYMQFQESDLRKMKNYTRKEQW